MPGDCIPRRTPQRREASVAVCALLPSCPCPHAPMQPIIRREPHGRDARESSPSRVSATLAFRSARVAPSRSPPYTISRMRRRPQKPNQLARHGHRHDWARPALGQPPEAATQPLLRLVGPRNHPRRLSAAPLDECQRPRPRKPCRVLALDDGTIAGRSFPYRLAARDPAPRNTPSRLSTTCLGLPASQPGPAASPRTSQGFGRCETCWRRRPANR